MVEVQGGMVHGSGINNGDSDIMGCANSRFVSTRNKDLNLDKIVEGEISRSV